MTHTDALESEVDEDRATGQPEIGVLLRRVLLVPALTALALALFVAVFWLVSQSPNFRGHALGHWLIAVPTLFVALVFVRLPEARTAPRRMSRLFVAIVLVVLPVAQLLEGIGAFASSGGGALETVHGIGEAGTLFSVFTLPLSLVVVAVVYVSSGRFRHRAKPI